MKENMVLRMKELEKLVKGQDQEGVMPGEVLTIEEIIEQCRTTAKSPSPCSGGGGRAKQIWKRIASFQRASLPQGLDRKVKRRSYLDKIEQAVKHKEPVKIVLVAFPFKDPNPLVTNRITPDFGELLFVEKLLQIDEAVKTKYPLGAEITVLAEGEACRSWLGVSKEAISLYMEGIGKFINLLEGQDVIKIEDLKLLTTQDPGFDKRNKVNLEILNTSDSAYALLQPFFRVFFWSQDVSYIEFKDLTAIYYGYPQNWTSHQKRLQRLLREQAYRIATEYLAFQMAKTESIIQQFPEHLYVGITYKPERFCLGIPTLRPPHLGITLLNNGCVELLRLMEVAILQSRKKLFKAIFAKGWSEPTKPFYYTTS